MKWMAQCQLTGFFFFFFTCEKKGQPVFFVAKVGWAVEGEGEGGGDFRKTR